MKFVITDREIKTEVGYGTLTISANEEEGFRPYQLLVASIAGCSASVFRTILHKQRIDFDEFIIEADVSRNEKEANRVEKIALTFKIKGNNLDEKKMERNLAITRKHCSMVRSVENSIEIVEKLELYS